MTSAVTSWVEMFNMASGVIRELPDSPSPIPMINRLLKKWLYSLEANENTIWINIAVTDTATATPLLEVAALKNKVI